MATHIPSEAPGARDDGGVFSLWYPRNDAVIFGVWSSKYVAYDGGRPFSESIPGWMVTMTPPQVELVFPIPECAPALGLLLEQNNDPELRATLDWVLIRTAWKKLP
jgi:hypothetical protein